jgi:dTDP-4-amino-4,6-dideoxygalactose transaminase
MTELQGALLLAQLSRLDELTALRAENAAYL